MSVESIEPRDDIQVESQPVEQPVEQEKPKRGLGFKDPEVQRRAVIGRKKRMAERRLEKEKRRLEELIAQKEAERNILTGETNVAFKQKVNRNSELPDTLPPDEEEGSITDMEEANYYKGEDEDFFYVEGKDPKYYYRHAGGVNPQAVYRRVQQLKRQGYVVVDTKESTERAFQSENRSGEMEKTTGIPGHILMRLPMEVKLKREAEARAKNKEFEKKVSHQMQALNELLKDAAIGGSIRQELKHIPQQHKIGSELQKMIEDVARNKSKGTKYFT